MLPKQIDPIQLANNKSRLHGKISFSEMERLTELLSEKTGHATIDFEFGRDELGYAYIQGSIEAGLKVICQRCNKEMSLLLNIPIEASPVHTDAEAERLPTKYDPLLLTGMTVLLAFIVEEEILLSIPIIPRHIPEECPVKDSHLLEWEDEEKNKSNPFDVLKKLLRE